MPCCCTELATALRNLMDAHVDLTEAGARLRKADRQPDQKAWTRAWEERRAALRSYVDARRDAAVLLQKVEK